MFTWEFYCMFTVKNYIKLTNHPSYLGTLGNWIHVRYWDVFWLSLLLFCIWFLIKVNSLRYKFVYFIGVIWGLGCWGYWVNLDGMVLMMFLTELLVILLFLLVFLSYNFFTEEEVPDMKIFYFFYLGALGCYALSVPLAFWYNFEFNEFAYLELLDVASTELFFFFQFFFVLYPTITIYVATLLGVFSILFICIYFTVKRLQQATCLKKKNTMILRKQNFVRQALVKPQLTTFQK